jgi:aspartate ammonia-lyase
MNSSRRYLRAALTITLTLTVATAPDPTWARQAKQQPTAKPRIEKDLLGEKEIPGDAYYGVQTARALENFQLSGVPINHYPGFIEAWAIVKLAAAQANTDVGAMGTPAHSGRSPKPDI